MAAMMNVVMVKGPKEAYHGLASKGEATAQDTSFRVFAQSFYAGCYIGFGALLATNISNAMPGLTKDNPGLKSFVFAALFPVNLLLILLTGGILFTGTSAACPAAFYEGAGAVAITEKKVSKGFGTTFLKGIGCNWMVCMAVFLSGQSQDMVGKYLGIWFPISAFVMIGFEHIPANFYLTILGLLADKSDVTLADVIIKNWLPTTLGNFFAGAFIVAGGYSFFYGRLGEVNLIPSKAPKAADAGSTTSVADVDPEEGKTDKQLVSAPPTPRNEKPKEMLQANPTSSFERCISNGTNTELGN